MKFRFLALLVLVGGAMGCQPPASQPLPRSAQGGQESRSVALVSDANHPTGTIGSETAQRKAPAENYSAEAYRLVNEKSEIVSVLRNGLVVITKRTPSPVLTVRGYAFTGGVYEGKWLGGGLSHLLEHLVAGGSNARRTEEQNKDLLQKIGNNSNAYTTEDHTAFFVNTTPQHMAEAVDLVTGWMFTASITKPEYEREYEVVQRELEMGKGEPDRQLAYMMASNRYLLNPARVPVIGYQAVIQGLSRDDVYNYFKQAYVPNNMMFVVAGHEDPEKMLNAVQKFSGNVPPGRAFSHDIAAEPPVVTPRTLAATFPMKGPAKVNLAFPSVKITDPDLYALDLLAAVLGTGESSLLVEEIRDHKQLVSSIMAEDDTPAYASGSLDIMFEADPAKVNDATNAILDALEEIKKGGVGEDRLSRAKTIIRAARVQHLQTTEDAAESMAIDYINTGDPHFSDQYVKRIDELTAKDVQAVAQKYIDRGKLITTAMFPAGEGGSDLPKVEDVLRPTATTQPALAEKAAASPITRTVLDNGTILLVKRVTTSPLVSIQMYSVGGVTAEDAQTNGLGNLTMLMLPRGTKTRSARQIAEFFDSVGFTMDTTCGNNTWSWNMTCLKDDLEKVMEVYADVVNNPSFPEDETAAMKKRVAAAIAGEDADWEQQAMRFFKKEYFGPLNSPYQFLAIGTAKNVEGFTVQQMRDWYEQKIQKAPRVLAVFGDVDPDQVQKLAAGLLGKGERRPAPQPPGRAPAPQPEGSQQASVDVFRVAVQKTEQELAGVAIGYKSNGVIGDPMVYPMTMADTLTSGYTYPTGYLFETLRGQKLVYVADAVDRPGRSAQLPGNFMAFAGCEPKNVDRVVDLMLENIARLQGTPQEIDTTWFGRAKDLVVVADAMEHETPAAQAQLAAVDEALGLGYAYHERFADHIRKVSLPEVQQVARQRLRECLVTISTPNPELVHVKPGVRTYRSFPPIDLTPRGVQHDTGGGGK